MLNLSQFINLSIGILLIGISINIILITLYISIKIINNKYKDIQKEKSNDIPIPNLFPTSNKIKVQDKKVEKDDTPFNTFKVETSFEDKRIGKV